MSRKKNAKPRASKKKKNPKANFLVRTLKFVSFVGAGLKVVNKVWDLIKDLGDFL